MDTVFVCREPGTDDGQAVFDRAAGLVEAVGLDVSALAAAGRKPTLGRCACVLLGHMTRMAVRDLRQGWNRDRPTTEKLAMVREATRNGSEIPRN